MRLLPPCAFRRRPDGARTSLYAASVPDLSGGGYLVPDGPCRLRGEPVLRSREHAVQDTATAHRLWAISERLTGVRHAMPTRGPART